MRLRVLPFAAAVLTLYGCASPWSGPRYGEYPPGRYRTAQQPTELQRAPPPGHESNYGNEKSAQTGWHGAPKGALAAAPRARPEAPVPKPEAAKPATAKKPAKPSEKEANAAAEKKPAAAPEGKPVTPAEIRAAVPLAKVTNPRKTLAAAQVKTLYGDVLGKVHSVDVSGGGAVNSIEVDIGKKTVRLDAAKLKYVRSRNLLVTGMSKAQIEKLPAAKS